MKIFLIVVLAVVSGLLWSGYQKKATELDRANVALQSAQEQLQKSEQLRQQAEERLRRMNPPPVSSSKEGTAPRAAQPPAWFQQKLEQERAHAKSLTVPH